MQLLQRRIDTVSSPPHHHHGKGYPELKRPRASFNLHVGLTNHVFVLCLALLFLSCSSTITDIHDNRIKVQLRAAIYVDVPFVPQSSGKDCGAAALSSVGQFWDFDMTPRAILKKYPLKSDAYGYSMGELKRIAQREGLAAFVLPGNFTLIEEQIRSGRPLIVPIQIDTIPMVMQPFDHYVIIVGMSKARSTIIVMDPQKGLITLKRIDFMKAWSAKGKAILIAAPMSGDTQPAP